MTPFLQKLAERRRFGMKPGLDTMIEICRRLDDPERRFRPIHVAGTNGKGAVCAMLDACLGGGRYTSPHLVRLNERFFLRGEPVGDDTLDRIAARVAAVAPDDTTFFEALTAVAFALYAESGVGDVVLETGLGGRLDATNVCEPRLCVITRMGLEHCDWLGDTLEKIAFEKAGIIKPGIPVVLGANEPCVRAVVEARARELGAPFFSAPELAAESELPADFSLAGAFNRENGVTALAALKVLRSVSGRLSAEAVAGLSHVVWPGRFQRVGADVIVDGAHNPPAARALADSLAETVAAEDAKRYALVAGFCSDKDVDTVLKILSPFVARGFAVRTQNPRSLSSEETAAHMTAAAIPSVSCRSLGEALRQARSEGPVLVCGSLFLAGEALVELGAYPWGCPAAPDPSELLRAKGSTP